VIQEKEGCIASGPMIALKNDFSLDFISFVIVAFGEMG